MIPPGTAKALMVLFLAMTRENSLPAAGSSGRVAGVVLRYILSVLDRR